MGMTHDTDSMSDYVYCEICRDVHAGFTRCRQNHAWITLGQFPSRNEAIRKARWYGYVLWKDA